MNLKELTRVLESFTEENIEFNEPHVSLRCEENKITKGQVVHIMLHETSKLSHFSEDRPNIYKLYFKVSKSRQLKVIIDLVTQKRVMIRTVKIIDRKLYKNIRYIKGKKRG